MSSSLSPQALKNPSDGMKVFPEMWAHFHLMDKATEGRLEGSAPVLKVFPGDKDNRDFLPISKPKKRRRLSMGTSPPVSLVADRPEIEVSLNGDEEEEEEEGSLDVNLIMQEVDDERNVMDAERQVMDKEIRLMERERLVLQRERAVLDREVATLERDRATLHREMATMEREKVVLEREKAMMEKDKDTVCRERRALERERARLQRLFAPRETTEEATENHGEVKDSHAVDMDRKERFLYLFEKLIESFWMYEISFHFSCSQICTEHSVWAQSVRVRASGLSADFPEELMDSLRASGGVDDVTDAKMIKTQVCCKQHVISRAAWIRYILPAAPRRKSGPTCLHIAHLSENVFFYKIHTFLKSETSQWKRWATPGSERSSRQLYSLVVIPYRAHNSKLLALFSTPSTIKINTPPPSQIKQ